jgi:ribonuclease P protein component
LPPVCLYGRADGALAEEMKREQRLVRSADFDRVRKMGRSWAQPLLVLAADRNDLDRARFGFVVSRRVGNAVVRNRVKRRLREAMRRHLPQVPPGWDVVIVARQASAEARFSDLEAAIVQALDRAQTWFRRPRAAVETESTGVGV